MKPIKKQWDQIALNYCKIILTPFIILALWFCLGVFKDVAKGLFVKEKKVKTVGIVISK